MPEEFASWAEMWFFKKPKKVNGNLDIFLYNRIWINVTNALNEFLYKFKDKQNCYNFLALQCLGHHLLNDIKISLKSFLGCIFRKQLNCELTDPHRFLKIQVFPLGLPNAVLWEWTETHLQHNFIKRCSDLDCMSLHISVKNARHRET